jgi:hypothetical protein
LSYRRPFQDGEDSVSRITYDLAVKTLMDALPEFVRSSAGWSPELPYVVYGDFASYVSKLIGDQSEQSRSELQRAFSLINSLAEAGDDEVINLLQVSVLETLTDTPDSVATARALLGPKARAWFEGMLEGWLKPRET